MNKILKLALLWTARVPGILFMLFVRMFVLDTFWETVVGLFTRLIPAIILTVVMALVWRWEWIFTADTIGNGRTKNIRLPAEAEKMNYSKIGTMSFPTFFSRPFS